MLYEEKKSGHGGGRRSLRRRDCSRIFGLRMVFLQRKAQYADGRFGYARLLRKRYCGLAYFQIGIALGRALSGISSGNSERALRASVLIQTNKSLGSGVIYSIADEANANGSKNAYVITNNHVIEGSSSIYTYLYGDNYVVSSILPTALETRNIGSSKSEDIAVLSVEIPEDRLDFVQAVSAAVGTRDSDTAKVGEKIYAIGNPLG